MPTETLSPKLHFSPNHLTVTDGLTFEEYETSLEQLVRESGAAPWWIGDLLAYAEEAFGEQYAAAVSVELAQESGVAVDTVMQYQWVSSRIPADARVTGLSWSHHRTVAALDDTDRDAVLVEAKAEHWSVGRTNAHVRKLVADSTDQFWLIVSCTDPEDRNALSDRMKAEQRAVREKTTHARAKPTGASSTPKAPKKLKKATVATGRDLSPDE